jgi:acetyl esterase/lipase
MLPHLPPSKSFAEYADIYELRKSIDDQIAQGVAAGIFQFADLDGIKKDELQIPTRDGATIRALHFRPESSQNGPLIVYYHGGGWTFGQAENWHNSIAALVKELGFVVVSVDYSECDDTIRRGTFH